MINDLNLLTPVIADMSLYPAEMRNTKAELQNSFPEMTQAIVIPLVKGTEVMQDEGSAEIGDYQLNRQVPIIDGTEFLFQSDTGISGGATLRQLDDSTFTITGDYDARTVHKMVMTLGVGSIRLRPSTGTVRHKYAPNDGWSKGSTYYNAMIRSSSSRITMLESAFGDNLTNNPVYSTMIRTDQVERPVDRSTPFIGGTKLDQYELDVVANLNDWGELFFDGTDGYVCDYEAFGHES